MAQVYGRTWWGQQWLKSLDRIDYSNRLPRGKSYANTGKVKSIEIEGHIIRAKVAGSRPKPYDVSIVVPPFTDKEKKALIESIKKDNLILSQLLNRHLPNELLSLAEQNFIKIFPQSWQDLKLNCSCPDWAVPCKHLAAVIYTVATQIDQNPFSVFTLHSLDLIKELAKERLLMEEEGKEKIYTLSEAIEKEKYTTIYPQPEVPDFSIIESLQDSLPILFPASPLFFSNDFKPLIQRFYKYWAKSESQYLTNLKNEKNNLSNNFRYHHFKIIFNNDANVEIWATDEDENKHLITSHDLLTLLAQTESKHLPNYSQSFILLYRTFRFINILIERNALLPRLLKVNDDTYQIQWIPALINESVKNTFSKLMQWYQNDIIVLNNLPSTKTKKETLANHTSLHPEDAMILLSSFFTATSISSLTTQLPNIFTVSKNKLDDKILVLFFQNKTQSFDSFSEKEIPNTIQLWLKRFFIGKKEFSLILQVSELEGEGFEVDVLIRSNNAQLPYTESLYDFMLEKNEMRLGALKDLQLLAYYMPGLNTLISSGGEQKLKYNTQTFSEVLTAILPTVRMLGIQTLLPKSLQNLLRPKVSLSLKGKKGKTFFTLNDMIDYDWKVSVGEQFIDLAEFKKIVSKASGLVKIRNEYVMMTKEDIERIIKKIESSQTPPSLDLLRSALSEDYYGASVHIDEDLKKQIKKLTQVQETSLPNGIKASLRPYQHRGYSWMYKNAKLGIGSLLADDMGLGKTLQVITTLLKFKEDGLLNKQPALVIAPTTLLSNWKSEIQKFAPKLRTEIFHGIKRKSEFKNTDVVITTYGIARTDTAVLNKKKWHVVVIDEAQNIKNNSTAQTKAVKKIKANVKIAMSGTPVENRLSEYWSIFDFANPDLLGSETWFDNNFANAIEINQDKNRLDKFHKITSPFILRRVKTDKSIISDLPDKIENNQYCSLSKEQAALYKNLTTDLLATVEKTDGIERKGLILKLLIVLKQICNHPAQYLKVNDSVRAEQSGKMLLLLQLLETIYENNEKVLIFSQFQEAAKLLQNVIHEHFGKKALLLHGGCSRKERDEMVKSFQNQPIHDTFILSLKAGGTGLNLTAANHVIHFDLWWNPAVEAQATDRAFRIGQKKNVMVHRLITKGTLEEKIDDMLKSKKALANLTISSGEKWIGELSDKDIQELVSLAEL